MIPQNRLQSSRKELREAPTALPGFRLWPGLLDAAEQAELLAEVRRGLEAAPLYRPVTPGGRPFSVRMSNFGALGWVSDRTGYRYQPTHPVTGASWPAIPDRLLNLWDALTVNGKIYGVPRETPSAIVTYVRKDWLDRLGMEVPTTYDQFIEMLTRFKNEIP